MYIRSALIFLDSTIDVTTSSVRSAPKLFNNPAAVGSDQLPPKRMTTLPDADLDQLGCFFKESVATLTAPVQQPLNLFGILGKKQRGSMTIPIIQSFHGELMQSFGAMVKQWDKNEGHSGTPP